MLPDVLTVERAGLACWPGLVTEYDRSWVRRAANGYTKRANCVQSLDPADDDAASERLAASRDWFVERGLTPVFRVTPLAGPRVLAALDAEGWSRFDLSHLRAVEISGIAPDPGGEILPAGGAEFLSILQRLADYSDTTRSKLAAVIGAIEVPVVGVVVRNVAAAPVSASLMAVAEGIVFTNNVITAEAARGQGFGSAMMRTGLAWAVQAGARVAALNVQADNVAGNALYEKLGYRRLYDYLYRSPGAA